jgi:hypothetical protein
MTTPASPEGTTFAVSSTSGVVFEANGQRDEIVICNDLAEAVYLQYGDEDGAVDAVVGKGPRIPAGGTFVDGPTHTNPKGDLYKTYALSAVVAGAGGNLSCSEGSRTI